MTTLIITFIIVAIIFAVAAIAYVAVEMIGSAVSKKSQGEPPKDAD